MGEGPDTRGKKWHDASMQIIRQQFLRPVYTQARMKFEALSVTLKEKPWSPEYIGQVIFDFFFLRA